MQSEEPIHRLCRLIDSLPDNAWGRKWALHLVAHLLGIRLQRTGLEATPERTIAQLVWDYETSDLRVRMIELAGLQVDPEFLVKGALALLRESFGDKAGREGANQTIRANQQAIDDLVEIRATPNAERPILLSDEDIQNMIDRHQQAIDMADENAAAAAYTRSELDRLACEFFPTEFWTQYSLSRLHRRSE